MSGRGLAPACKIHQTVTIGMGMKMKGLIFRWLLLLSIAFSPAIAWPESTPSPSKPPHFTQDTLFIQTAHGKQRFTIELATTPEEQEYGLMFRHKLPREH